jgi:pimeloyl-ACP methyl ester carboxylesterase
MHFQLPVPSTSLDVELDDGARIRIRRHGFEGGIRLLLSHGNGFAADGYYPYWQYLLKQFDLVIFDFRNHGQNVPVTPANHNYTQFARDLECVVRTVKQRFGEKPTAGLFHSMSARTAMKHAIEIGWCWDALVLFDPPNVPPRGHQIHAAMEVFEHKLIEWARQRRRCFASVAELAEDYRQSRATVRWVTGAHELMARSVLRKSPVGDAYELVCDPENEAAIYAEALTLNLWPKACEFDGPIALIGCDPNVKGAPATGTANQALAPEGGYNYCFVEGMGHLLQIEKPQECVRLTLNFLAHCGLAVC